MSGDAVRVPWVDVERGLVLLGLDSERMGETVHVQVEPRRITVIRHRRDGQRRVGLDQWGAVIREETEIAIDYTRPKVAPEEAPA